MKKYLVLFLVLILAIISPLSALAEESLFAIKAEEVSANRGDTVSIKFTLSNNPGISLLTLGIDYDKTKLQLKEINGNSLMGGTFMDNVNEDYLLWMSSSADSTFNGTVFTAVFEVLKTAETGKTNVSVSLPYEDSNILNYNGDDIQISIASGCVDIKGSLLSGDVNADNVVDLQDVTVLAQYLAGWKVTVNKSVIDIDGNGVVNLKDLVLLVQYVAGWDVELS